MSTIVRAKAKCRVCGAQSENVKSVEGDRVALVAHRDRRRFGVRCFEGYATVQDVREWISKEILYKRERIAEIPERKTMEEDRHRRALKSINASEIELTKEHAALERLTAKYR